MANETVLLDAVVAPTALVNSKFWTTKFLDRLSLAAVSRFDRFADSYIVRDQQAHPRPAAAPCAWHFRKQALTGLGSIYYDYFGELAPRSFVAHQACFLTVQLGIFVAKLAACQLLRVTIR